MSGMPNVSKFIHSVRMVANDDVLGDLRTAGDPVQPFRYRMVSVRFDCLHEAELFELRDVL